MKKLFVLCLLFFSIAVFCNDNPYCYYTSGGQKECLIRKNALAVRSSVKKRALLNSAAGSDVTITSEHSFSIIVPDNHSIEELKKSLASTGLETFPVFGYGAETSLILNNRIGLNFKNSVSENRKVELLNRFKLVIVTHSDDDPGYYLLKHQAGVNVFELAEKLYNSKLLEWVQPDWYEVFAPHTVTPSDTYFDKQWQLPALSVPQAWEITTGSDEIKIGVLDYGVDTHHIDLILNLLPGKNYIMFEDDNDPDPHPEDNDSEKEVDKAHGTCVAGLIAARGDNNTGVAGVCWNCKILPARVLGGISISGIYDAMKWATDQGASLINNSYGKARSNSDGDCISVPVDNYYKQGIDYAKEYGRDGLGTLTIWSAGNDGCDTANDQNLHRDDIIVVSALEADDSFALYSNFGKEIDVAAIAGNQLMLSGGTVTTDYSGGPGYSKIDSNFFDADYTNSFDGTSAAAPLVTGAAALALSVNKCLTLNELITCIKVSTDKIDKPFSCYIDGQDSPWGTIDDPHLGIVDHSLCYGFGKINVLKLVEQANDGTCGGCPEHIGENTDEDADSDAVSDMDSTDLDADADADADEISEISDDDIETDDADLDGISDTQESDDETQNDHTDITNPADNDTRSEPDQPETDSTETPIPPSDSDLQHQNNPDQDEPSKKPDTGCSCTLVL